MSYASTFSHPPSDPVRRIEIRAAEGGTDARLLVAEVASSYLRYADRNA